MSPPISNALITNASLVDGIATTITIAETTQTNFIALRETAPNPNLDVETAGVSEARKNAMESTNVKIEAMR